MSSNIKRVNDKTLNDEVKVFDVDPTDVEGNIKLEGLRTDIAQRQALENDMRRLAEEDFRRSKANRKPSITSQVGSFLKPKGFEQWTFYRCGSKARAGDRGNEKQAAQSELIYREMRATGWQPAPPDTKWVGSSGITTPDTDWMVCLPMTVHAEFAKEHNANKRYALDRAKAKTVEGLADGVTIGGKTIAVDVDRTETESIFIPVEE